MNRCIKCSKEFEEKRSDAKFCSNLCKNEYWNYKIRQSKTTKSISEFTEEAKNTTN